MCAIPLGGVALRLGPAMLVSTGVWLVQDFDGVQYAYVGSVSPLAEVFSLVSRSRGDCLWNVWRGCG